MRNHHPHTHERSIVVARSRGAPLGALIALGLALLLGSATAQQNHASFGSTVVCDAFQTVSLALDTSGVVSARGIDLTCALLSGANLEVADLRGANLTKANLSRAILSFADLSCAITFEANLTGADLRGANLDHAILTGANLTDVNLRNATVRGAVFTGVDLTGADLFGADLTESWFDNATIWPQGFDPIAAGALNVD